MKWKIRIAGYGTFDFNGTEAEAEDMRSRKSQWEKGSGIKWCVSDPTEVDKLTELMAWYFDNGSGCPAWLFRARAKCIKESKLAA